MFTQLVLCFEVLTPLFMGNAEKMPELRAPAFKGLLRFWYRAAHPGGLDNEARIFGGTGRYQGQAPFLLSLDAGKLETRPHTGFNIHRPGRGPYPGLSYLGYPFNLKGGGREAIVPETWFKLFLLFPDPPDADIRKGILAAAWLLGHVGGGGTRSKRGFGAFSLTDWQVEGDGRASSTAWPEKKKLPLLYRSKNGQEWVRGFKETLDLFQSEEWFGAPGSGICHPHFGLCRDLFPDNVVLGNEFPRKDWARCLNDMGEKMQTFRLKYSGDYDRVKSLFKRQVFLECTPDRAAFGLPLAFRYGRESGPEFLPRVGSRHASLLLLRPVLADQFLYPLYLKLNGALPGGLLPGDRTHQYSGTRIKNSSHTYPPFLDSANAVDEFLKSTRLDYSQGGSSHG